jgi:hypothetical protein
VTEDRQFQAHQVVRVDPILGCLAHESALAASSGGVTLDWMAAGPDEVVELREFDDKPIIVVLVERSFLKVFLDESGLQGTVRSFL